MTVGQAFDRSVAYYDNWIRTALPGYDAIFAAALDMLPFSNDAPLRVLDLGAGTGLFSQHVVGEFPLAHFTLYDLAPKMLALAAERFRECAGQFEFVEKDFRLLASAEMFDVVISSLSIHHLTANEKRQLFAAIFRSVRTGGVFVNVDQIKAPSPEMQQFYWERWLADVRAKGADEAQIQASIQRRTDYDQDDTLIHQLSWLSDAGFASVDCVYKDFFMGVFYARKP